MRFYSVSGEPSGYRGKKFVAVDAGGDSAITVVRIDSSDASVTANVNISRQCDLLRQSKNKFDRGSRFQRAFSCKVQPAEADVARLTLLFDKIVVLRESNLQRQHHRESASGASFDGVIHRPSYLPWHFRHATTAGVRAQ